MQIQSIQCRPKAYAANARPAATSEPLFGYEPKDPKRRNGLGDKFNDMKRKMTPDYQTKQDMKQMGIGGGVIIGGQLLGGMLPALMGGAVASITMMGGGFFAAYALMRILSRKSS